MSAQDDNDTSPADLLLGAADVIGEPDSMVVVTVPSEGLLITVSAANLTRWLTNEAAYDFVDEDVMESPALAFAHEVDAALASARARAAREAAEEADGGVETIDAEAAPTEQ